MSEHDGAGAPRPAERRSGQTHQRILEAARDCFARYGYEATGVAEICQEAAISKGALYHHFASKQEIFIELYERWMRELEGELRAILERAPSVPQALVRMAKMVGRVLQAAEGQLPLYLEFLTRAPREPDIWRATTAPYQQFRRLFAEIVRRGIAEGSLSGVDPERMAQIIVSYGAGLVLQGVFDPAAADWDKVGQEGMLYLMGQAAREGTL